MNSYSAFTVCRRAFYTDSADSILAMLASQDFGLLTHILCAPFPGVSDLRGVATGIFEAPYCYTTTLQAAGEV